MPSSPSRKLSVLLATAALLVLVAASFVFLPGRSGSTAGDATPRMADPALAVAAGADVVRFAVVGDSITADHAYPRDVARRVVGQRSWVNFAQGDATAFVGGWAVGGATTAQMADGASPIAADVLVMIAGTNDIHAGVPFVEIGSNLERIVETVGVPRVLVSSVPPRDAFAPRTLAYNAWLERFVSDHGWDWVDASAGLRSADPGRYAEGLAYDGVHPSRAGAREIGTAIRAELREQPTAVDAPAPVVPDSEAVPDAEVVPDTEVVPMPGATEES
ncbi:SGNH/GDSL hydrolase family protein [Arthrobacter sp. KK5.5]|uniref:SGNH/GDSL hydrolase family protein n=1 Tax=Arthrobacter sp. KK5.5 TaxID=3373084 RepID=UPI003EE5A6E9